MCRWRDMKCTARSSMPIDGTDRLLGTKALLALHREPVTSTSFPSPGLVASIPVRDWSLQILISQSISNKFCFEHLSR